MTKNEITKFGENNLSIFAGNDFFHQIADETNLDLSIFSIFDEMEISLKILRSLVQSGENEKAIEIGEKWLQIVEIENEKIKINKNTKNEDLTKKKKIVQILLDLKKIIEKAKNENEQKSAAKLIFETEAEKEKKFYEKIENGIDKKKTFSKKINLAEKLILIFIAEKKFARKFLKFSKIFFLKKIKKKFEKFELILK